MSSLPNSKIPTPFKSCNLRFASYNPDLVLYEHYFEKDLSSQIEDIIFNVEMFKSFIK